MSKEAYKQAQYKAEGIIIWFQVNIDIFSLFILSSLFYFLWSYLLVTCKDDFSSVWQLQL